MGEEVKVFGEKGSPFSNRVEIALKLKGVSYEFIKEDLGNKSELLLKYNPVHKKIPVLLHNGKPIAESIVILHYIDETWESHPILPQDPYDKAMALFWAKFMDEKCFPALWKAFWCAENEREKAVEEARENLKFLENELGNKKFFGGESIGMVDIVSNFIGFWAIVIGEVTGIEILDSHKFPKLCNWIDEFVSCTAVKESLPDRDKLASFFRSRSASASASK